MAALAAYTNLMAPDPVRTSENRERCEAALRVAGELGTNLVVTETGSYHPHDSWSRPSGQPHGAEAWAELVEVTAA